MSTSVMVKHTHTRGEIDWEGEREKKRERERERDGKWNGAIVCSTEIQFHNYRRQFNAVAEHH